MSARPAFARLALLAGGGLFAMACTDEMKALEAPLPATRQLGEALHVVVTDADLYELAEYVRQSPGNKVIDLPLPPFNVPGTGGAALLATKLHVEVESGSAAFESSGEIRLQWVVNFDPAALSLSAGTGTLCALTWTVDDSDLRTTLRFARDAQGVATVMLAKASSLSLANAKVSDPSACLGTAAPGAGSAIAKYMATAVSAALTSRYEQDAALALSALLPAHLERKGQSDLPVAGETVALGIDARFAGGGDKSGASLLDHQASYGHVAMEIGLDMARHGCAADEPPPTSTDGPISPIAPAPAGGSQPLRRALVVERRLLGHFGWAVARSGLLCRSIRTGLEASLPASWAGDVLSPLSAWVQGGPVGAAFWPGGSPILKVKDLGKDAGIEWLFPDALLELSATMAGLEVVVLRVEGTFRLTTWPLALGPWGVSFDVRSASVDSAVVTSPLLAVAPKPAEKALADVVDHALIGIFGPAAGLPLQPTVGGSKVVGTARDGDHLWIWLVNDASPGAP